MSFEKLVLRTCIVLLTYVVPVPYSGSKTVQKLIEDINMYITITNHISKVDI
jgi:hypothetical protein